MPSDSVAKAGPADMPL